MPTLSRALTKKTPLVIKGGREETMPVFNEALEWQERAEQRGRRLGS
jgi:hypothetical protein